jgi:hypothetical protein
MKVAVKKYLAGVFINLALLALGVTLLMWNEEFLISISRIQYLFDYAILLIASSAHFVYFRSEAIRTKLAILGTSLPLNFIAMFWLAMEITGDTL